MSLNIPRIQTGEEVKDDLNPMDNEESLVFRINLVSAFAHSSHMTIHLSFSILGIILSFLFFLSFFFFQLYFLTNNVWTLNLWSHQDIYFSNVILGYSLPLFLPHHNKDLEPQTT